MRHCLLLFLTILVCNGCFAKPAQKKVSVEYTYHIPNNVSQDDAREIAVERAKAQAIADEFGTIVTQSTSIQIENSGFESTTDFLSIGGSELKGEWLETIGEPIFEYITDGNDVALRVKIKGVIREIEGSKVPFEAKILRNGILDGNENDQFISGDDIYVSFSSPTAGYLAIYLIDAQKNAFCLLPYQSQDNGIYSVKANTKYVFFHPDSAYGVDKHDVDEIVAETSGTKERNRIIFVFSPRQFYKASDNKTAVDLPRNLSYETFQKWLSNLKKRDVELSAIEKSILIVKK